LAAVFGYNHCGRIPVTAQEVAGPSRSWQEPSLVA